MKKIGLFVLFLILVSSCTILRPTRKKVVLRKCASPVVEVSYTLHQRAKSYFSSYYKTRKEEELFYAWYASEDSNYMANKVRRCRDKRNRHFHAIRNLLYRNQQLQRLIVQNMRTEEHLRISELFLDEYRKVFPRDIH
ncbi:MAG: hypothetical protein ACI86H_000260 [bacterium]|jgi:hypothetical protein